MNTALWIAGLPILVGLAIGGIGGAMIALGVMIAAPCAFVEWLHEKWTDRKARKHG
jgi:hypothetical protein